MEFPPVDREANEETLGTPAVTPLSWSTAARSVLFFCEKEERADLLRGASLLINTAGQLFFFFYGQKATLLSVLFVWSQTATILGQIKRKKIHRKLQTQTHS